MRNSKLLSAAVAISTVVGIGAASAADLPARTYTKAPTMVDPGYNWTGFYVGLNAGGAWGQDNVTNQVFQFGAGIPVDFVAINSATSPTLKRSGFIGGGQVGYNWQAGHAVFGFEADFDYLGLRASTAGTFPFPSTPGTFFSSATSVSNDWLFTGRGRIGWAANNFLLYATGGVAVAQERYNQNNVFLGGITGASAFSTNKVGWVAGVGAEYAINTNWSVKAEYLYVDLGTVNTSGSLNAPSNISCSATAQTINGCASSSRETLNIARVGINYRWGAPVAARY